MSAKVSVQNTFIHMACENSERRPLRRRARTDGGIEHSKGFDDDSTDDDVEICMLSRETTFDEFEEPCMIGGLSALSDDMVSLAPGSSECEQEAELPELRRCKTFDDFDQPCILQHGNLLETPHYLVECPSPANTGCTQPTSVAPMLLFMSKSESDTGSTVSFRSDESLRSRDHNVAEVYRREVSFTEPQPEMSTKILPNGIVRIEWCTDARRFSGRCEVAVSPAVSIDVPGLGSATFKVIVRAGCEPGSSIGGNFRASNGRGIVELKCEDLPTDETYEIMLDRNNGTPLGMDLVSPRTTCLWWIKRIGPGLVEQWNTTHLHPQVNVGDAIVSVNGVSGDLQSVREACRQHGLLKIVLKLQQQTTPTLDVSCCIRDLDGRCCPPRVSVKHNFAERSCCRVGGQEVWDLTTLLSTKAKKIVIACDLAAMAQ